MPRCLLWRDPLQSSCSPCEIILQSSQSRCRVNTSPWFYYHAPSHWCCVTTQTIPPAAGPECVGVVTVIIINVSYRNDVSVEWFSLYYYKALLSIVSLINVWRWLYPICVRVKTVTLASIRYLCKYHLLTFLP